LVLKLGTGIFNILIIFLTIDNVNDAIIIQVIGDFYEVFQKCLNENILFFKSFWIILFYSLKYIIII